MVQEYTTLSHSLNGAPLWRVAHKIVLFSERFANREYSYEYGFIGEDGIHYAVLTKILPTKAGDELLTSPNHLIQE